MFKLIKILAVFILTISAFVSKNISANEATQINPTPILTIDFRKPEYKTSTQCIIHHDAGTEFNPTCGKSWKIDRYNSDTNEFSFLEIEFILNKDLTKEYALEILACARKDFPLLSRVNIEVNGRLVAKEYSMYNGPDSIHFPDESGKPSHLRWEVFDITNELETGSNTIRISLDSKTESGFSTSWIHIRPMPKP